MRRYAFYGHLIDCVEGFDKLGGWAIAFRDEAGDETRLERPVVMSRLRRRRHLCAEEFAYLRGRTDRVAKATLVSAQQAAAYFDPDKSAAAYPSIDAYLADVVDILRDEVAELARLGCTYVQIDAPQYAGLLDPAIRAGYQRRGTREPRPRGRALHSARATGAFAAVWLRLDDAGKPLERSRATGQAAAGRRGGGRRLGAWNVTVESGRITVPDGRTIGYADHG